MPGGDGVQLLGVGELNQPAVAKIARRYFQAQLTLESILPGVTCSAEAFEAVMGGQVGNESLVGFRVISSKLMIEVHRREHDPQFVA